MMADRWLDGWIPFLRFVTMDARGKAKLQLLYSTLLPVAR